MNLGILEHAQKRPEDAARHLEEARRIAESMDLRVLLDKVRAALAALSSEGSAAA